MPGESSDYWHEVLTGQDRGLRIHERWLRSLPSPPRCKLCMAPFSGPYAPFLKLLGFRRWRLNQQMCRFCVASLEKHPGGAEIPVSLLFTDVRGSTSLAETMPPAEFSRSLSSFFGVVVAAVDAEFGVIDHIVGDGVMAMWIPGFVGEDHARRAVAAGRRLVGDLCSSPGGLLPAGVGVHTGTGYVGVVGEPGSYDFTVLGDVANTTARLGSAAAGGELILSERIVEMAEVNTGDLSRRVLELKGKAAPFPVWVEQAAG